MMKDVVFAPDQIGEADDVLALLANRFHVRKGNHIRIARRFIDARHKDRIKIVYRVEEETREALAEIIKQDESLAFPYRNAHPRLKERPVIVGFGPAGMYAGLVLAEYGLRPLIIERGSDVDNRAVDIDKVRNGGAVDPESNVQFGEGGAGTFSDGKLYTGVTSGLKAYISRVMVDNGADPAILYDAHPHVGTDKLRGVVKGIREKIISLGGEILFDTVVKDLIISDGKITGLDTDKGKIPASDVILAIGHSSRDTIRMLLSRGVVLESKPFAVGVRIEHRREDIDKALYGFDTACYRNISAAPYKLSCDTVTGRKLYTFCMCPGGEVVAAQSSGGAICTNGMSYSDRGLTNSNTALLVPVNQDDYGNGVLDGMYYQEKLEYSAFIAAGSSGMAPFAYYGRLSGKNTTVGRSVSPSFKPGVVESDLKSVFDEVITDTVIDGISRMGGKIRGFDIPDAVITAPEARSSSPVRILRDKTTFMSVNVKGLYPCGEGAGYAGGIMSSAIDGIKCANAIIENVLN